MSTLSPENLLNSIKESSAANTAQSQAFAREQMKFNAEQAALSRQWQENMSNTAHQREVKDLIAAGLNPVLSTGGQGASTPSGASAVGASGKVDNSYSTALAGYATSLLNTAAQVEMAKISASASLGSAAATASASRYSADKALAGSLASSSRNLLGTFVSSARNLAGTKYSADMNYKIKRDFPGSFQALGSAMVVDAGNFLNKTFGKFFK